MGLFSKYLESLPGLVSYWPLGESEPTEVVNLCPTPTFAGGLGKWVKTGGNYSSFTIEPKTSWHGTHTNESLLCSVTLNATGYAAAAVEVTRIPATPSVAYTAKLVFNVLKTNVKKERFSIGIGWESAAGERIGGGKPSEGVGATGETVRSVTVVAPSNAAFLIVEVGVSAENESGVSAEWYMDEIQVVAGEVSPEYKDPTMPGNIWSGKAWESSTLKAPVAKDSVGTNNGEYTGGVMLGEPGLLTGDTSTSGKFDGSTGYVRVPHAASLSPASAITLGAVVDPTASGNQVLIGGNINTVNLCPTPTFAGGVGKWHVGTAFSPTTYSTWHGSHTQDSLLCVASTKPSEGSAVIALTNSNPPPSGSSLDIGAFISVVPGRMYSVRINANVVKNVSVENRGIGLKIALEFYNAEGAWLAEWSSGTVNWAPGVTGSQLIAVLGAEAPSGTAHCVVRCIGIAIESGAEIAFDEAQLVEGTTLPEYRDPNFAGYFWSGKAYASTTVLPYYALELVAQKLKLTLPIGTNGELTTLEYSGTVALSQATLVVGTYDGSHLRLYLADVQVAELAKTGSLAETSEYLLLGSGLAGKMQGSFIGSEATSAEEVLWLWRRMNDKSEEVFFGEEAPILEPYQFHFNGLTMGPETALELKKIDGLDLPAVRSGDSGRPRDHGLFVGLDALGGREITLSGDVKAHEVSFQHALEAVAKATAPTTGTVEIPLLVNTPGYGTLGAKARVRKRAMPRDIRFALGNLAETVLLFAASDPRLYGPENSASISQPNTSSGFSFPMGFPVSFGGGSSAGILHLTNAGDIETRPVFTVEGPCSYPSIALATAEGVPTLMFDMTMNTGDKLVIDTDMHTATYYTAGTTTGSNRLTTLGLGSQWFTLPPGESEIQFSSKSGEGSLSVKWASAYLI